MPAGGKRDPAWHRNTRGGRYDIVSVLRDGDQFWIRVLDDGAGLPRNWQLNGSSGLGVRVTRERLGAFYPELRWQALLAAFIGLLSISRAAGAVPFRTSPCRSCPFTRIGPASPRRRHGSFG